MGWGSGSSSERAGSYAKEKPSSKAPKRRRRIFSKKRASVRDAQHTRSRDNSRGVFPDGVFYGVVSWIQHTAINLFSWLEIEISEGGRLSRINRAAGAIGGEPETTGAVLVVGFSAAAALFLYV